MTAKKDDKPKRKAPTPIPVIGVRGSSTKISLAKTAGVAAGVSIAAIAPSGRLNTAVEHLSFGSRTLGQNVSSSLTVAMERGREIWDRHGGKILIGGGIALLFGAGFDRRYKDFPVRLGR